MVLAMETIQKQPDHERDCRDRKAWREGGRKAGKLYRAYRDRRSDRYLCQRTQPEPEGRLLIGQGMSMQEAMDEVKMVVEGVYSTKAAVKMGEKYGVSLPIIGQVNQVLFENKNPGEAVKDLMLRDSKPEISSLTWEE